MTNKLEYYTRNQVCDLLGIKRHTLKMMIDDGDIVVFKLGKKQVILKSEYVRFIGGCDEQR